MIYTTLKDHLFRAGITEAEACELFGRTPRTLKNWNDEPPEWTLRIIRLMRKHPPFPDCWDGWYFDRHFLVDPAGNSYSITDINHLFFQRQFFDTINGSTNNILNLKSELERKIKHLESTLTIQLSHNGQTAEEWKIAL